MRGTGGEVAGFGGGRGVKPVAGRRDWMVQVARPMAGNANAGVVLLCAADVIRNVLGRGDVIQLRGRETLRRPGASAVSGNRTAAIVAIDHALRIARVDPQIVMIGMR